MAAGADYAGTEVALADAGHAGVESLHPAAGAQSGILCGRRHHRRPEYGVAGAAAGGTGGGANGERAGFWRLVVVREAGFYLCLLLASRLPLLFFSPWESALDQTRYVRPLLLALGLLMLCVGSRRTLQDMLAGTAVADARPTR